MGDVKTWLDGIGPKPEWIETSDPTKTDADPVVGGIRLTITKSMLTKLKGLGQKVFTCFGRPGASSGSTPDDQ